MKKSFSKDLAIEVIGERTRYFFDKEVEESLKILKQLQIKK